MKIRTVKRHFTESIRSLVRNSWMSIASISAVTVTLLIVGVFLTVMLNINYMATSVEKDVEIRVYMDVTATDEAKKTLYNNIEDIPEVETIQYKSKEEELQDLIDSFGQEGQSFQLFEQDNPLSDVYVIKTTLPTDVEKVAKSIQKFEGINKVDYGQEVVERIFSTVSIVRNIGVVLIFGLLFTAMFLISNTIKITIFARKNEIEIMRLVGAKNSFIRWPFVLEGFFLGTIGSIIPILVVIFSYRALYDTIAKQVAGTMFEITPVYPFVYQIAVLLVLIGSFIGMWGSLLSVRRFLKI